MPNHQNTTSQNSLLRAGGQIYAVCLACLVFLGGAALLFLALSGLLRSATWPADYLQAVQFRWDPFYLSLLGGVLVLGLFAFLLHTGLPGRLSLRALSVFAALWAAAVSLSYLLAFRPNPVDDAALVQIYTAEILNGSMRALEPGFYLSTHPHQLGYALFTEVFFRLFSSHSPFIMQLVNVPLLALCFFLVCRLSWQMFKSLSVSFFTVCLLVGFLPPLLCVVLVYGTIPGLVCALAALSFTLSFCETQRVLPLCFCALFSGLSVLFKSNYLVFSIGIGLVLVLHFFKTGAWRALAGAAGLCLACFLLPLLPVWYYESVAGFTLAPGMPRLLWAVMGLQEGPIGPGWYNSYNDNTWLQSGYDPAVVTATARADLSAQLSSFGQNPFGAASFFWRKVQSQWLEPSFEAFRISHAGLAPDDWWPAYYHSWFYGLPKQLLWAGMNLFQFLVYLFCGGFLLAKRKTFSAGQLLPLLVFVGGFLFHLVWEAKSQYAWPYFILLLPYAAAGLEMTAQWILRKWQVFKEKRSFAPGQKTPEA